MRKWVSASAAAGLLALSAAAPASANDTVRLGAAPAADGHTLQLVDDDRDGDDTELVYRRGWGGGWNRGWGGGWNRGWGGGGFSISFGSGPRWGGWGNPYWGGWNRPYWGGYGGWNRPYWGGYYGGWNRPYWGGGYYGGWNRPYWGAGYSVPLYSYPAYTFSSGYYYPCADDGEATITTLASPLPAPRALTPAASGTSATYPYDGGPRTPLPMPSAEDEANPTSGPRKTVPLEGRLVSLPRHTTGGTTPVTQDVAYVAFRPAAAPASEAAPAPKQQYRYPAYGESR